MTNTNMMKSTNTSIASSKAGASSKDGITRDYRDMAFQFREDGYFNMTKAAKHFGKDLSNFMRSPDTIDYLDALATSVKPTELIETKAGRYGGSWGHPKMAVFFARWLDVKFAVWYVPLLEDQLRGKAEVTITKPEESAVLAHSVKSTDHSGLCTCAVLRQGNLSMKSLILHIRRIRLRLCQKQDATVAHT